MFSSLTQLAVHRMVQGDDAGAQLAADEARALVCPDWPAMLRIRLLRIDAYLAASAGRVTEALALHRDAVRVSVSTGDWLLEVMARENLADLLWRTGPIEAAAMEACSLVDALRQRPLTALDMAGPFAAAMGILSEMGRIDEASAAAREALPLQRLVKRHDLEFWAYLFWRRGQPDLAACLLGASDARLARTSQLLYPNERRLIAETRAGLATALDANELARALAAGASLSAGELLGSIAEALSLPRGNDPLSSSTGAGACTSAAA
jgi:ATP/maltotriose-dependent transcriptional regulator MalT